MCGAGTCTYLVEFFADVATSNRLVLVSGDRWWCMMSEETPFASHASGANGSQPLALSSISKP